MVEKAKEKCKRWKLTITTKRKTYTKEQKSCPVSGQSLNDTNGAAAPSGGGKSGYVQLNDFDFASLQTV